MITFNVRAHNSNYYRGHEPSNKNGNCWCGEQEDALVFTIEQARELVKAWKGYLQIVIALSANPMKQEDFEHELYCAKGGSWCDSCKTCQTICSAAKKNFVCDAFVETHIEDK